MSWKPLSSRRLDIERLTGVSKIVRIVSIKVRNSTSCGMLRAAECYELRNGRGRQGSGWYELWNGTSCGVGEWYGNDHLETGTHVALVQFPSAKGYIKKIWSGRGSESKLE